MELKSILKFKIELMLNNRMKRLPKLKNQAFCFYKTNGDYEIYFGQVSVFREILDRRDSLDAYNFLLEEQKVTHEVADLILEFISTITRSLLLTQIESQYYENNFLKNFFLLQILDHNKTYYEYNLKNFLRYSYASTELYKNIFVCDEGIYLKDSDSGKSYIINEIIKKVIYIICPKEYVKDIEEFFSFLLMEEDKIEIGNILNDEISEYISLQSMVNKSEKKICNILLKCIEVDQEAETILVSKFLLNTFLHYVLKEDNLFLEKNKKYLVKQSENKKILKNMYYVLFNLNQVKGAIWDKLESENIFIKNEDFFYRYNITNGIKSKKKFFKKYCGKI